MRKHLGWYAKGREDQPGIRARLVQARDLADVVRLLSPDAPRFDDGLPSALPQLTAPSCG